MIRVVPTGDLGLDVLLGGGWRLVKRFEERESATVVVRGGSGTGKTLMGIQIALELAKALDGDVVVACVEILPTEYIAQLQSARQAIALDRVSILPARPNSVVVPRIYVGLLAELDPERPDLVAGLEQLDKLTVVAGGRPTVFVVDSLIEGYGVGSSASRIDVDDVLKFAARYGHGLVLCEEVGDDGASAWVFAADTVLHLGVDTRERGRWIEVRKHRFGPSATGRHELEIGSVSSQVFPAFAAWLAPWVPSALVTRGWRLNPEPALAQPLRWNGSPELQGALICIASSVDYWAQTFAEALRADSIETAHDTTALLIRFEALDHSAHAWARGSQFGAYVPIALGPVRALRTMVECFAATFGREDEPLVSRVLIGDLAQVFSSIAADAWLETVRTFGSLVAATGWGLPIVTYDSGGQPASVRDAVRAYADVAVMLDRWDRSMNRISASISYRWSRQSVEIELTVPGRGADLTPRPAGRG